MKESRKALVQTLVDLVCARVALFADAGGEPYAALPDDDGGDVLRLRARGFRAWFDRAAYLATGGVPSGDTRAAVLSILEGRAAFDAPRRSVHVRIAEHDGAVWVDLGGPGRDAVRVDARGWSIVRSEVSFLRPPSQRRLARPQKAADQPGRGSPLGPLGDLRALLPQLDDPAFTLFVGWMLGALRPRGPYPLLVLQGERGAGKSTLARAAKTLLDPAAAPLRAMPRSERDLAISTTQAWIGVYDNLAPLATPASDALCRVSTGGGLAARKLFTDGDEVVHEVCRPVILTGIEDLAVRPDLLERSLVLRLTPLSPGQRREEAALLEELEAIAPGVLGALLDAASLSLAARDAAPDPAMPLPRMADFARWVSSAEPALGWAPGRFLRAHALQQAESDHAAFDVDPVAPLLLRLPGMAESGRWEGTASEMWDALAALFAAEGRPRPGDWPRAPNSLAGRLRSLQPVLRAHGVDVAPVRTATSRRLVVTRRAGMTATGEWPALEDVKASA